LYFGNPFIKNECFPFDENPKETNVFKTCKINKIVDGE